MAVYAQAPERPAAGYPRPGYGLAQRIHQITDDSLHIEEGSLYPALLSASRALKRERNLIDEPDQHWLYLIGRLKADTTIGQAQARLTLTLQNWRRARAGSTISAERSARIADSRVELTPAGAGVPRMRRDYGQTLRLLLGIAMAVLLIACANIAGLLLARGTVRRPERSLRLALGATRSRLVRESLTESLMLAFAGGALALPMASAATTLLLQMVFRDADYVPIQTTPDVRLLAFTFALSCAAAVAFGVLPAIKLQSDIQQTIKRVQFPLGKALIVGEVAASLVVLAAAGSLARSLSNIANQPFGFDRSHVLVATIDPALAGYELERLGPLYQQLQSRLNSLPGVASASLSHYSPFNGCCWAFSVAVPGYTPRPDEPMSPLLNRVSPRYFETLGTRVRRGRAFDAHDTPDSQRVAVVSEAFAQRFFPNTDPIGRSFTIESEADAAPREIIGIVENAKYDTPREEQRPMAYLPLLQMSADQPQPSGDYQSNFVNAIEVRSSGDPTQVARLVGHTVAEIDHGLPVLRVATLSDHVSQMLRQEQTIATLAACFGMLALGLSCIGLYGLMAYLVQRRTSEIGIRIALGARRAAVVRLVIREALAQAAVGILMGLPITFAAARLLANQLYGVSPADPRYAAAAAVAVVAALGAAGYLPSRRASRIDPIRALHQE